MWIYTTVFDIKFRAFTVEKTSAFAKVTGLFAEAFAAESFGAFLSSDLMQLVGFANQVGVMAATKGMAAKFRIPTKITKTGENQLELLTISVS